ncbi:MAG: DUF4386 domain-containing protein [Chitinophagaceae bacterium]|nr:DUF4386 domain-containing protein [Chitinophagaceae bacterium]
MEENLTSLKKTAKLAGILFLLAGLTSWFSLFYIRGKLIDFRNVTVTANNIIANETLSRLEIVSILISQVFQLFIGLTLFRLFKGVHKTLATVLLASVITFVAIAVLNTLNNIGALLMLSKADYLNVFEPEKCTALMMLLLRLGNYGQGLLEIFWAIYLFAFGLLIIKSGFMPRLLGILMIVGSVWYTINTFTELLIPHLNPALFTRLAILLGGTLGVGPTIFWLLIKGIKTKIEVHEV